MVEEKLSSARPSYSPAFANEVFARVDSAEKIKTCMGCGICSGSCPFKHHMEHSPRKLFAMIRAGRRQEVLECPDIMLCTSCYACQVRCPRGIPVIDVMHGLAHYALENGYTPRAESAVFGRKFWSNIQRTGRVDEKMVATFYMLAGGPVKALKKGLAFWDIGLKQMLARRMPLLPARGIKGKKGLKKMLAKAQAMSQGGNLRP